MTGSHGEALEAAKRIHNILQRGSSLSRCKRGHPATTRPPAIRAYVIRKFNPDPKQPGESTVSWAKLADMLFVNDGNCSRSRCGRARHQYNDFCVKALRTAVGRLQSAMLDVGIPI
jgi:hypothetical protein